MSRARLTLILYPFGAGAMAVNLFFAALITSWIGWPVLTPVQSVIGGALLGIPATWLCAPYPPLDGNGGSMTFGGRRI